MSRASAGTVQVAMNFRQASELVVAVDPTQKQLLLIPQPRGAADESVLADAPTTTLSQAQLPLDGRQLFVPYTGQAPAYTIEQVTPEFAYVNFENARLDSRGVQYTAPSFHTTLSYWMLSERSEQLAVRLGLALHQAGSVAVFQDRTNQRLVIELDGNAIQLGARTRTKSRLPSEWPGEQRLLGKKAS